MQMAPHCPLDSELVFLNLPDHIHFFEFALLADGFTPPPESDLLAPAPETAPLFAALRSPAD